jgi:regulator of protease activity HflC (stomatin/prohibitin superfamily)
MDLDETLSKRDEINHRLLKVVDEATSPWGVKVTRIEIKDIQPREKQSVMLDAEGRKEAAFRDAEARERSAEAEARATDMVSKAIAQGNTNALNYFVAQKYIEALKGFAMSPNQKVFFLPVEASSLIASIGGIAELAKDAMQKQVER